MLIISHGQASVERGFSCNKQSLEVNMQKESLVGKRMVKDHIQSIGGIQNFILTPELLHSCSLARARYSNALQAKKADVVETVRGKKRKALNEEITEMKKIKLMTEKTIKYLQEDSDSSGTAAEKEKKMENKIKLFSKATSLRQSVKAKELELKDIEKTLEKKESLLKSV